MKNNKHLSDKSLVKIISVIVLINFLTVVVPIFVYNALSTKFNLDRGYTEAALVLLFISACIIFIVSYLLFYRKEAIISYRENSFYLTLVTLSSMLVIYVASWLHSIVFYWAVNLNNVSIMWLADILRLVIGLSAFSIFMFLWAWTFKKFWKIK